MLPNYDKGMHSNPENKRPVRLHIRKINARKRGGRKCHTTSFSELWHPVQQKDNIHGPLLSLERNTITSKISFLYAIVTEECFKEHLS